MIIGLGDDDNGFVGNVPTGMSFPDAPVVFVGNSPGFVAPQPVVTPQQAQQIAQAYAPIAPSALTPQVQFAQQSAVDAGALPAPANSTADAVGGAAIATGVPLALAAWLAKVAL